ncbi:MAG: energy transducer TonB [Rikenellaceae bacterium]
MKNITSTLIIALCVISNSLAQNINNERGLIRWFEENTQFPRIVQNEGYTCKVEAKLRINEKGKLIFVETTQPTHWAFLSSLQFAIRKSPLVNAKKFDQDILTLSLDFSRVASAPTSTDLTYIESYTPPMLNNKELPYEWIKEVFTEEQRFTIAKAGLKYMNALIDVNIDGTTKIKNLTNHRKKTLFTTFNEPNALWTPAKINGKEVAMTQTLRFVVDSLLTSEQLKTIVSQEDSDKPVLFAEVMPTFQGGDLMKFRQWVIQNLKYPREAFMNKESGVVVATFIVDVNGSVRDINVIKSPSDALSEEAIRIISLSPKWTPAEQRGKKVNIKYTVPIVFRLQ